MLLLSLVSCLLSGENESRKSANAGKLALFFQMQTFSDPVSLQSVVSIPIAFRCYCQKYTLSFLCTGPFYVGGQLEKAVVLLTYGDYNGKYSFEWKIPKIRFLMWFSVSGLYKRIWYIFWAQ